MPGNGGKFKVESHHNQLKPSLRAQRSNPFAPNAETWIASLRSQ
jgi:hypothetical protein